MDLIDDHRLHGAKRLPAAHGRKQQVKALRRGDEQFRRAPQHARSFAGFGVAAARLHAQIGQSRASRVEAFAQFRERRQQVGANVVVQRLQRRDVEHARGARFRYAGGETVDGPQKGRQRLAAAVGAVTSKCSPAAMRGQLCVCTSVGSPNAAANHWRIKGWNRANAVMRRLFPRAPRPAGFPLHQCSSAIA